MKIEETPESRRFFRTVSKREIKETAEDFLKVYPQAIEAIPDEEFRENLKIFLEKLKSMVI